MSVNNNIKIGDYVFLTYSKSNVVFVVTSVERRYADEHVVRCSGGKYKLGDEINPLATIEPAYDLNILPSNKKIKKIVKQYDVDWLQKIDQNLLTTHISNVLKLAKSLNNI